MNPLSGSTTLLAVDSAQSTLHRLNSSKGDTYAFMPFGYTPKRHAIPSLLFNGELLDFSDTYLLGLGYHRPYSPYRMRFNSPDTLSPFGKGGKNAYAYCAGDPVNYADPTGHNPASLRRTLSISLPITPDTRIKVTFNTKFVNKLRQILRRAMPNEKLYKELDILGVAEAILRPNPVDPTTQFVKERLDSRQIKKASDRLNSYSGNYEKALEQEAKAEIFRNQQSVMTATSIARHEEMASQSETSMKKAQIQLKYLKNVNDRIRNNK